jgi:hypothetical protein
VAITLPGPGGRPRCSQARRQRSRTRIARLRGRVSQGKDKSSHVASPCAGLPRADVGAAPRCLHRATPRTVSKKSYRAAPSCTPDVGVRPQGLNQRDPGTHACRSNTQPGGRGTPALLFFWAQRRRGGAAAACLPPARWRGGHGAGVRGCCGGSRRAEKGAKKGPRNGKKGQIWAQNGQNEASKWQKGGSKRQKGGSKRPLFGASSPACTPDLARNRLEGGVLGPNHHLRVCSGSGVPEFPYSNELVFKKGEQGVPLKNKMA